MVSTTFPKLHFPCIHASLRSTHGSDDAMEIKPEFGYVVAAIGGMFVPLTYGAVKVIQARKKFGVHCA